MKNFLSEVKGGLIVSCQALENEPLHSSFIMGRMAVAAESAGAVGIRANSKEDIIEIKKQVALPVVGIVKRDYVDSDIYITATMKEIEELVGSGCEMIALDSTDRLRPEGKTLKEFYTEIRTAFPNIALMADISTLEEAIYAEKLGFDCVSTTLVGYTTKTSAHKLFDEDFAILKQIIGSLSIPVIAEGNVLTPEMAKRTLELGVHAVVVGGAITRPQQIAKRFVDAIR
ncbi:N-acetylmannosamine-6-phosphate 2-epimerase [Bacillus testis]|uniref:N-acetylmannosamine-6-phosphate 2-epimerase n=1 Tax=Bacillus testis TaxID=1622072 RepID=UPI00067EEB6B|nr:N-acetylmannosamine-6-phosphate 2-epimerase [Bacillus testis]